MWACWRDPREYTGYLGHYHVTDQKWDPGPFDFKFFASKIRGRMVFPVAIGADKPGSSRRRRQDATIWPRNSLFENNENEGEGGYFPVGPLRQSRLWHGGVHSARRQGHAGVRAVRRQDRRGAHDRRRAGRLAQLRAHSQRPAGRLGADSLLDAVLPSRSRERDAGKDAPGVVRQARAVAARPTIRCRCRSTSPPAISSATSAKRACPGALEGQLHVEVMSADEIGEKSRARLLDTPSTARAWGASATRPTSSATSTSRRRAARRTACCRAPRCSTSSAAIRRARRFASWRCTTSASGPTTTTGRSRSTGRSDFAELPKPTARSGCIAIRSSRSCGGPTRSATPPSCPSDKLVWNYHPITFIVWLHDKLRGAASTAKEIGGGRALRGQGGAVEHQGRRRRDRRLHRRRGRASSATRARSSISKTSPTAIPTTDSSALELIAQLATARGWRTSAPDDVILLSAAEERDRPKAHAAQRDDGVARPGSRGQHHHSRVSRRAAS